MNRSILKTFVLGAFGILLAMPARADVRADLGPLRIRIATDAPPRVRREVRPPSPGRDAVWIDGYWDRQDDRWAWVSGRWEQGHDRHDRWVKARYQREGQAWRYEPAHWSNQRLEEGDDYRQWREKHSNDHGHHN